MVLDLRNTVKALKQDLKNLAGALHQMSTGADVGSVLQGLPPMLLQDALRYGSTNSAPVDSGKPGKRYGRVKRFSGENCKVRSLKPLVDNMCGSSLGETYTGTGGLTCKTTWLLHIWCQAVCKVLFGFHHAAVSMVFCIHQVNRY